jgi:type 1 glutamine amidotransferase
MRTMSFALALAAAILASSLSPLHAGEPRSPEGIPRHQEEKIRAAAPEKARAAPKKPRRVLIWSTPPHLMDADPHKGYCVPYGLCAMRILGEKTGAYEPVPGDDIALLLPESLARFDAIVLNNACGPWITPSDAAMEKLRGRAETKEAAEALLRKSFLDFVSGGRGIAAIHFALGANRHWPEFHAMLGATFTGHPWNEEVAVAVEEPEHPLVAAFGGKRFRLADEIYEFGPPFDRKALRVLLSLDTSRTNMGVKWINRDDGDFAQAWVKPYGKGRVFYTGFGHRTEVFWNPAILRFYLDGIQFATGDLEAPAEPRDSRPAYAGPGPTPPEERARRMKEAGVASPTADEVRRIEEAAPSTAPARPAKPQKVLVWGHSWAHTPNPYAEAALPILGKKTGAFEAMVSDDPRLLVADRLARFDVLVLNNIHEREPFLPAGLAALDAEQQEAARALDRAVKASILAYVREGKGIAGIHAATAAFQGWPEGLEMLGGVYASHIEAEVAIRIEALPDPRRDLHLRGAVLAGEAPRPREPRPRGDGRSGEAGRQGLRGLLGEGVREGPGLLHDPRPRPRDVLEPALPAAPAGGDPVRRRGPG